MSGMSENERMIKSIGLTVSNYEATRTQMLRAKYLSMLEREKKNEVTDAQRKVMVRQKVEGLLNAKRHRENAERLETGQPHSDPDASDQLPEARTDRTGD